MRDTKEPDMQLKRKKPGTGREDIRKYLYESHHSGILIEIFYDKKRPLVNKRTRKLLFIVVSGISQFRSREKGYLFG
jgi:hypothetical protein